jgi:hypothetical protein
MKLSHDEKNFLRHWIHDEAHYQQGVGPAKRLQVQHRVAPANLATIIAAAIPDLNEQEAAAFGPPPVDPPIWPWSDELFRNRLDEAKEALAAVEK